MKLSSTLLLILIAFTIFSSMIYSTDIQQNSIQKHDGLSVFMKYPDVKEPETGDESPFHKTLPPFPEYEKMFLEDNIKKSEAMTNRLDDLILRLRGKDHNISELEQMVDDYSLSVNKSRKYLKMAQNSSTSSTENVYLTLSQKHIIQANSELKYIFDKVKTYLPGNVRISNNETLVAEGSGVVFLSGHLDVVFSMSNGTFSVVDFAGDLNMNTDDNSNSSSVLT
jgi:hypothetical protein